jgi:hypothetical protein
MTTPNLGDDAPDYDGALPGAETELAPSATETEAHTAWALDDGPEWKPPFWTPAKITAVAVTVAVLAVVVVAGLAGYHLRTPDPVAAPVASPTSAPISAVSSAAPADERKGWGLPPDLAPPRTVTVLPPSTVTVTKEAPPPVAQPVGLPPGQVSVESPDPRDPQFIANMRAQGWAVTDERLMAMRAHQVCGTLQDGLAPSVAVERLLITAGVAMPYPQTDITQAQQFVTAVINTYPNCN